MAEQTKHTPGPWTLKRTPSRIEVRTDPMNCYAFSHRDEANAQLIAAAPDLLVACIALTSEATDSYCDWCKRHAPKDSFGYITEELIHLHDCVYVLACAAIAKALGEDG